MQTPLFTAQELPVLLFDPAMAQAGQLAAQLHEHRVQVSVALSAEDALLAAKSGRFRVLVVAVDTTSHECLRFLSSLRRTARSSWLVVTTPKAHWKTETPLLRHGVDAMIRSPIQADELVHRISSLQVRSRPLS